MIKNKEMSFLVVEVYRELEKEEKLPPLEKEISKLERRVVEFGDIIHEMKCSLRERKNSTDRMIKIIEGMHI